MPPAPRASLPAMLRLIPSRTMPAAGAVLLTVAVVLRVLWPSIDPPDSLSWSGGIYTDPPYNYLAARYALESGDGPTVELSARYVFPLLTAVAHGLGATVGLTRPHTVVLSGLLSAAALAMLVGVVRRAAGGRAALLALALGALLPWLVLFSRILMAENLVALMLAGMAWLAIRRNPAAHAAAAAVAAAATLFGKYHAVGPAAGILLFVALRERTLRSLGAMAIGGAAVTTLWVVTLAIPHGPDIVDWITGFTSAGKEGPPILASIPEGLKEIVRTFRAGLLPARAPVVLLLGGAFALWTLGHAPARRRRLEDGTAVFAFWFLGGFLLHAFFPYTPPRYFIPLVYALIGGAAVQAAAMMERAGAPSPRRLDVIVPTAAISFFTGVGVTYALAHLDHWIRGGPQLDARLRGEEVASPLSAAAAFNDLETNLLAGAAVGLAMTIGVLLLFRSGGARTSRIARTLTPPAIAAALIFHVAGTIGWTTQRSHRIETMQTSLRLLLHEKAVVLGAWAPLLTEGGPLRPVWYPLAPGEGGGGLLQRHGVTHVLVAEPSAVTVADLENDFPGITQRIEKVHEWHVRMSSVRRLALYRLREPLPGTGPETTPTDLERALAAANADDFVRARQALDAWRSAGRPLPPEWHFLDGVCRSVEGDATGAEAAFRRAADADPGDPLAHRNVGLLAMARGDTDAAREAWLRSARREPDDDVVRRLRALRGR